MNMLKIAAIGILATAGLFVPASAQQGGVRFIPPVSAGDCVKWSNPNIIADGGVVCGGNIVASSPGVSIFESPGNGAIQIGDQNLIDAETGTLFTIPAFDGSKLITFSNGSAITANLPQAGTTGYTHGWRTYVEDLGAGTVTLTPATSTINGAATLAVATGTGCGIVSDGTNYQIDSCTALLSGSGFPITLGSTSVAAGSTTTTITGLTLSGPTLSGTVAGTPTVSGLWTFGAGGRITQSGTTSSGAWTTSGVGVIQSATFNDVSTGTGTIAEDDINVVAPTHSFNNTVTVTNQINTHFKTVVAGTGATFTNNWALEADSFRAGTSNFFTISTGGVPSSNGTAGVTCSGSPTASFASTNGIVTHC
jgi:hypothetical protein